MDPLSKRKKRRFVGIPYNVASSSQFCGLSCYATRLLVDLLHQYTGKNNGQLSACWTLMEKRGWKSRGTLHRAFKELKDKGFVVVTRQGMKIKGYATLCAVTWDPINDYKVRYDDHIKINQPALNLWRNQDQQ